MKQAPMKQRKLFACYIDYEKHFDPIKEGR